MKELNISYSVWKILKQNATYSGYQTYHLDLGLNCNIWFGNRDYVYKSIVIGTDLSDFITNFQSSSTETYLENDATALIVSADAPRQITSDGRETVAITPAEGNKCNYVTHDFCDKTTWYTDSIKKVDEIATCDNPATYTIYSLDHTYLIDSYHGKIFHEDFLLAPDSGSYRVIVKVNSVTKTEQDPHYGSGGDYTINYVTGVITFLSALIVSDEVKVTYYYATTSNFIFKPPANKILRIKEVEVQFAEDIVLTDAIEYGASGFVDVFAPQYTPDPYPSGTLIPLGNPERYKTLKEIMSDANGNYPELPAIGGSNWRGCNYKLFTFPWKYAAATKVISVYGMEIYIKLQHDEELGGSFCTATFYTSVSDL